jgi:hypothetical protein
LALAIGVFTPARSGPFCVSDCVEYPYTDVAAYAPRDYWWMYPAVLGAFVLVVLMASVYVSAARRTMAYGLIATLAASMAATALGVTYFVQLATVQPSLLKGEQSGLALWSMYNQHGLFIALEDLGYWLMSASLLFAAAVFAGATRIERGLRWLLAVGGVLGVAALPLMALVYRADLSYRYEVLAILVNWSVLIVAGVMLTRWERWSSPPARDAQ